MQYILTEEEYQKLLQTRKYEYDLSKKQLQELCSDVCDNYPVKEGWHKGKPWGCILTKMKSEDWYCDECIMQKLCPYEYKHWSK